MVWLRVVLIVLGMSMVSLIITYLLRRKKMVWIPSLILAGLSILFLGLGQLPQETGSWNDLIFTLFGMIFLFSTLLTALITLIVKMHKRKPNMRL